MTEVVPTYDVQVGLRADKHRYEPRVRMKVDVIPLQQQIAGANVPHGEHLVDVPESMVDDVMKMVTPQSEIDLAKKRFEKMEEAWRQENGDALSPNSVAGAFRMMFDKDIGALRSAEIVQRDIAPPLSVEEMKAAAIAKAVNAPTSRRSSKSNTK